ncbi:hypothetical protein BJV82DRAFT_576772 [Fennellomyces sp. T-0311]|nr:hypothetical protein BJV82DRAFT_576772 [Fennellomyces sp. T-0311]
MCMALPPGWWDIQENPYWEEKPDVRTVSSGGIRKRKGMELVIAAVVCVPTVVGILASGIDIAVGIVKKCIQDHLWIGFWVKLCIWMGTYINIPKNVEDQWLCSAPVARP